MGTTTRENHMRKWIIAITLITSGTANADWSGNIGWASDYFYRGIFQARSSASGGIDYTQGGFYAGTWAADVANGLEVDGYFGFTKEIANFNYGVGFTGYYYTGDFDDTYEEINLSAGHGIATIDVAIGRHDNLAAATQDYVYYSFTLEKEGFYGKYAGFSRDFHGEYIELGYSTSVSELDIGLSAIFANADLVGRSEESLVFSIGKTFDF